MDILVFFYSKSPRPKWIIYKHVSDESKKCLSVGNARILSVVCEQSPAFPSICRGLEYLLKVRYIILVVPNVAGFLISNTVFLLHDGNTAYV